MSRLGRIKWLIKSQVSRLRAWYLIYSYRRNLIHSIKAHIRASRNSVGIAPRVKKFLSQNGEDGVTLSVLDEVGIGPAKFAELGFSIYENNCLSSALYYGLSGVFVDGSRQECGDAIGLLARIGIEDVVVKNTFITEDNVNDLLVGHSLAGELDLLSIDLDGNDYWIWRAIESVSPRIVVIEYNASFGAHQSVTIPYNSEFIRDARCQGMYHGASLQALVKLGRAKGYRLLGCDTVGLNAYFARNDVNTSSFPEIDATDAFKSHLHRVRRGLSQSYQEAALLGLPVVRV